MESGRLKKGKLKHKLISIEFICHGNICRSPMAEFVFRDMVRKAGLAARIDIASAATSTEEIGNPVHPKTRKKLKEHGISADGKCAIRLERGDYARYDYLIGMDQNNIRNMNRILGGDPEGKFYRLLDFTERPGDIADPWYTGDFDATYRDVAEGCRGLLSQLSTKLSV